MRLTLPDNIAAARKGLAERSRARRIAAEKARNPFGLTDGTIIMLLLAWMTACGLALQVFYAIPRMTGQTVAAPMD